MLSLKLIDYKTNRNSLINGFIEAEKLLAEERIFTNNDLPYSTQLIPLAVLCTLLQELRLMNIAASKDKLKQWYWCGVFGELYGSANETRYVNDVVGVMDWINNGPLPKTVQEAYFSPLRLIGLQTRISAAYKGIMALIMKNHSKDFISGRDMDFVSFKADNIDIHHVFPQKYCMAKIDHYMRAYDVTDNNRYSALNSPNYNNIYDCLYPLKKAAFCGIDTFIPADYRHHLLRRYGDYSELPPEEERFGHVPYILELGNTR